MLPHRCVGICQSSGLPSHLKPQAKIGQNIPLIRAHSAVYPRDTSWACLHLCVPKCKVLCATCSQVCTRCPQGAVLAPVVGGEGWTRRSTLSHAGALFGRALTAFLGPGSLNCLNCKVQCGHKWWLLECLHKPCYGANGFLYLNSMLPRHLHIRTPHSLCPA